VILVVAAVTFRQIRPCSLLRSPSSYFAGTRVPYPVAYQFTTTLYLSLFPHLYLYKCVTVPGVLWLVCPESSGTDYKSTMLSIPEERRSHVHRDGSLKSQIYLVFSLVFTCRPVSLLTSNRALHCLTKLHSVKLQNTTSAVFIYILLNFST
jgi:hypothetical protein